MKPNKLLRLKYHTDYADRSAFSSKARLLQSFWRTEKGLDFEKFGNFLNIDFAKRTGANYLTESIFEIVKYEVENARKKKLFLNQEFGIICFQVSLWLLTCLES
jgi:hypothetical protein